MATLIFSAVGTLLGGPLGGAVGALVGRSVDAALIGGGSREGPRLKELSVTTSSYGTPLARHYGRMRVPGSIIWATELVEHRQKQGGGKGRPSVTSYSYTASFAVALASRPIAGIGRIWADGNLLRGEAGDLKAQGELRIHLGHHDQPADPLIAQAEGAARCPAFRGLAYAVFEDLDLSDFYNRLPALTFEVIADDGTVSLQGMVGELVDDVEADVKLDGMAGFSCEGSLADTLQVLDPLYPMDCDACGNRLTIAPERLQAAPLALGEPAISVEDADFGRLSGQARRRLPPPASPAGILRYYDIGRDYQPGVQRAPGRPGPGQPSTLELPAALTANDALALVAAAARRSAWARETLAWRCTELDPAVAPGALVTLPGEDGVWKVAEWEWRASGVELSLARMPPSGLTLPLAGSTDPGRINPPADLSNLPSTLAAFELPWDGVGTGDTPALFAAVSSTGPGWTGAALFVDHGSGDLVPLGSSGRTRAVMGTAVDVLAPAHPLLFDRSGTVIVELLDPAMDLVDATMAQLAMGGNRALLGNELVQFGRAVPLGNRRWRLEGLLRGRAGTEAAVAGHSAGETFVLLDERPVPLDAAAIGEAASATILAAGLGDTEPVESTIALRGITRRPLAPVHPRFRELPDGSVVLSWTRRARGAWLWQDGVDTPLHEQSEVWQVTYGPLASPHAVWRVGENSLSLNPSTAAALRAALPGGAFHVRQQGSHALSDPLHLAVLA